MLGSAAAHQYCISKARIFAATVCIQHHPRQFPAHHSTSLSLYTVLSTSCTVLSHKGEKFPQKNNCKVVLLSKHKDKVGH